MYSNASLYYTDKQKDSKVSFLKQRVLRGERTSLPPGPWRGRPLRPSQAQPAREARTSSPHPRFCDKRADSGWTVIQS